MVKVELKEGDTVHVKFLRKVKEANANPSACVLEKDTDTCTINDIILIWGQPQAIAGTKLCLVWILLVLLLDKQIGQINLHLHIVHRFMF